MSTSKDLINSLYEFNTGIKELNETVYNLADNINNGYESIIEFRNLIDSHPNIVPMIEVYTKDNITNYINGVKALNEVLSSMIDYDNNKISDYEYKSIMESSIRSIAKSIKSITNSETSIMETATKSAIEQFVAIESAINDF